MDNTDTLTTTGPLPHTVVDFWHLVWQENIPLIIMLCNTVEGHNLRVRCQQYWPSSGTQKYGPFTVKLEKEQTMADYILRLFKITVCIIILIILVPRPPPPCTKVVLMPIQHKLIIFMRCKGEGLGMRLILVHIGGFISWWSSLGTSTEMLSRNTVICISLV